jgi:Hydrogenase/urease nickel incorporation, metallochaperone, hypA
MHVRIGRLAGVASDALRFSFDVAAAGTPIANARLDIEDVPGREVELAAMKNSHKIDLADAVDFDRTAALAAIQGVRPGIEIIELSARTGDGFQAWIAWLCERAAAARAHAAPAIALGT